MIKIRNFENEAWPMSMHAELTLEDMLAEPIVQLLMERDGVMAQDVRELMENVSRRSPWERQSTRQSDGQVGRSWTTAP